MNQRKEKQSCRFTVYGDTADALYLAARDVGRKFFESESFDLLFDDATGLVVALMGGPSNWWECEVTAVASSRVPS